MLSLGSKLSLIYAFFHIINIFMILINAITSVDWKITCVAGMGISLCVLRADTFMCLLLDQYRSFTVYSAADDEGKWHYYQDISHP